MAIATYDVIDDAISMLKTKWNTSTGGPIPRIERIWDEKIIGFGDAEVKKGIILIDPSYEEKDDYIKAINLITNNYDHFKNMLIIIWYPIIDMIKTNKFIDGFKKTGIKNILRIEMPIKNDNEETIMSGSGLLVFNSHKKVYKSLRKTIIELQKCLQYKGNKKKVVVSHLR